MHTDIYKCVVQRQLTQATVVSAIGWPCTSTYLRGSVVLNEFDALGFTVIVLS